MGKAFAVTFHNPFISYQTLTSLIVLLLTRVRSALSFFPAQVDLTLLSLRRMEGSESSQARHIDVYNAAAFWIVPSTRPAGRGPH